MNNFIRVPSLNSVPYRNSEKRNDSNNGSYKSPLKTFQKSLEI